MRLKQKRLKTKSRQCNEENKSIKVEQKIEIYQRNKVQEKKNTKSLVQPNMEEKGRAFDTLDVNRGNTHIKYSHRRK